MNLLFLIVFFGLLMGGIWLFFVSKMKKNSQIHTLQVQSLRQAISIHKSQITIRNNTLNKYDFQRYNLSETLISQEILKFNNFE